MAEDIALHSGHGMQVSDQPAINSKSNTATESLRALDHKERIPKISLNEVSTCDVP